MSVNIYQSAELRRTTVKIAIVMNLDWPLKRYHKIFAGIKSYADKNTNWTVSWDPFPEIKLEKDPFYYNGIIGRCEFETIEKAQELNIPIVSTWYSNLVPGLLSVFPDYYRSGELAAEAMVKRGYTNFVSINYKGGTSDKLFLQGVASVLKPRKCQHKKYFIPRDLEKNKRKWEAMHDNFSSWIKDWELPIAIITSVCDLGPKISALCNENNISIPEDAVLISSDNDLAYCEGFSPTISSVNIDYFEVGQQAAKMMDLKIKNQRIKEETLFIKPTGIVYRESTCHLSIADDVVRQAISFISDNYQKNIQINDVVRNFEISRRSLEKRFKDTVGHTIHEEISRLRIETMKLLLLKTNKSIKVLSREAGYSSEYHMRRAFKLATGMLPKEFRFDKRYR